jgi:radical SAM superfamily enzyme YgiQ (UPF0313 family)
VLDAIINKLSEQTCRERILAADHSAIIFTTGTATLKTDMELLRTLKAQRRGITVIASAGIMKFIGRELLRGHQFLDAVLTDYSSPDILAYLRGEREAPLRGLMYKSGGRLLECSAPMPREFSIPVPKHELFDFRKYRLPIAKRYPFTVVAASLGCPYRCGFCTAGAFGYRVREVRNVIEELAHLEELGVREILFADPTFTIDTARVIALCKGMIDDGMALTWSCNADIKSLNEEKVSWMKRAGCHTMAIGIESGDDAILTKYSKMITTNQIREAVALLNKHRLRALGYFIIGLPGETRETILKTIALAKSLRLDIASFAVATPDVGTPLREEALEKGWIPPAALAFDSTEFPIMETGTLSREEVWRLRRRAVREFYLRPSYVLRKLLQIRSLRDLRITVSNALSLLRK